MNTQSRLHLTLALSAALFLASAATAQDGRDAPGPDHPRLRRLLSNLPPERREQVVQRLRGASAEDRIEMVRHLLREHAGEGRAPQAGRGPGSGRRGEMRERIRERIQDFKREGGGKRPGHGKERGVCPRCGRPLPEFREARHGREGEGRHRPRQSERGRRLDGKRAHC